MKRRPGADLERFIQSLKKTDLENELRRNVEDPIYQNHRFSPEYREQNSIIKVVEQFPEKDHEDLFRLIVKMMVAQDRLIRLRVARSYSETINIDFEEWVYS